MQKNEPLERVIREAFEKKVNSLLAAGLPPWVIEECLLFLYFDSLRISVDNISITHQIPRSYEALKQLLIMRIIKLSDDLFTHTVSEEEIKFFRQSNQHRLSEKYSLKKLTPKRLKKYSQQIHKEIMDLMHSEYNRSNNMQLLISSLLFTLIHIFYRYKKISEINFIKIQRNWSDFFKHLTEDVSNAIRYFYEKSQKLH